MNSWNFVGNIGKDAEQRFIPAGDSIVQFSVAVKSGFGKSESTTWVRCNLWGKRGESLLPYLKKGAQVGVTGEAGLREWEKDGAKHSSLELRVDNVTLLGAKQGGKETAAQRANEKNPTASGADFDDSIPF